MYEKQIRIQLFQSWIRIQLFKNPDPDPQPWCSSCRRLVGPLGLLRGKFSPNRRVDEKYAERAQDHKSLSQGPRGGIDACFFKCMLYTVPQILN